MNDSWAENASLSRGGGGGGGGGGEAVLESGLLVPLYALIFVLAVVGNALVVATLARNRRMRTVTNVYLLNLAVSDLLLGVFCMPFTLVGQLLRNFVFGSIMCKLIPYFQAVSVSVAVWTLVAISLERYFAICRPLSSRRWQTRWHACKVMCAVWLLSLAASAPVLLASRLQQMREPGRHKCREEWPSADVERAYNLFLDVALLLVPLLLMAAAYSLVVSKLWRGLRREMRTTSSTPSQEASPGSRASCLRTLRRVADQHQHQHQHQPRQQQQQGRPRDTTPAVAVSLVMHERARCLKGDRLPSENGAGVCSVLGSRPAAEASDHCHDHDREQGQEHDHDSGACAEPQQGHALRRQAIRSNYARKSIEAKRKVIRMLFVVVAEFFVCWTPLHVLNTWYLFNPDAVYAHVGRTGVSLVQLVAYVSCCCHPITYCFMNRRFRAAFLGAFRCPRRRRSTLCWWESSSSPGQSPCQTPTVRLRKQVSCSGIHMVQNDQAMRASMQLPSSLFPEEVTND